MAPSKFRDLVLQSAERMATHLPLKTSEDNDKKSAAPKAKGFRKRTADSEIGSGRFAKRLRTRANQHRRGESNEKVIPPGTETMKFIKPSELSSVLPLAAYNLAITSSTTSLAEEEHAEAWAHKTVPQEAPTAPPETKLPKPESLPRVVTDADKSAVSHNNDAESSSDGFDEDVSLFEELLKTTAAILPDQTFTKRGATTSHSLPTPTKAGPVLPSSDDLTPPPLSLSQAPSPASKHASNDSSPIQPFLRQTNPTQLHTMPINMPWLKADHRIFSCFRIAEVIRLQSLPQSIETENQRGDMIELYARLKSVVPQGTGNVVQFADLFFPSRTPYLVGTCQIEKASAILASLKLASASRKAPYIQSSPPTEPQKFYKICRAIIYIIAGSRQVEVMSVKEADWEEVKHTRGIVEPIYQDELERHPEESTGS